MSPSQARTAGGQVFLGIAIGQFHFIVQKIRQKFIANFATPNKRGQGRGKSHQVKEATGADDRKKRNEKKERCQLSDIWEIRCLLAYAAHAQRSVSRH